MSSVPDDGREEEESPGLPGKRPQGLKGTLLDGKQSGNIEPSERAHQRSSLGYRLARQVPIPVARLMVRDVRQTAAGHPWLDSITLRSQAQDCWGPGSQTAAPERCPDVSNPNPLCFVKTRHPRRKTGSLAPTCHVWTERIGHPAQGTRPRPSGPRLQEPRQHQSKAGQCLCQAAFWKLLPGEYTTSHQSRGPGGSPAPGSHVCVACKVPTLCAWCFPGPAPSLKAGCCHAAHGVKRPWLQVPLVDMETKGQSNRHRGLLALLQK